MPSAPQADAALEHHATIDKSGDSGTSYGTDQGGSVCEAHISSSAGEPVERSSKSLSALKPARAPWKTLNAPSSTDRPAPLARL